MDSALADMGCKLMTSAVPTDKAIDAMLDGKCMRSGATALQRVVFSSRRCRLAADRQHDKEVDGRLEAGVFDTRGINIVDVHQRVGMLPKVIQFSVPTGSRIPAFWSVFLTP